MLLRGKQVLKYLSVSQVLERKGAGHSDGNLQGTSASLYYECRHDHSVSPGFGT